MMYRALVAAGLLCVTFGAEQAEQSHKNNYRKYIDEYVPAAYRSQALKNAKAQAKHDKSNATHSQKKDNDVLNLLEVPGSTSKSQASSSSASQTNGDYMKYLKKYAGSQAGGQSGSQSGSYQQYLDKYAGGSKGGQSGAYQQYLKKYAGGQSGDYQKYIQEYGQGGGDNGYQKYADYQAYIERYSHRDNDYSGPSSAHDAQNVDQLDAWKSHQKQNVVWYVPTSYSKYANSNIDRQYKQRLAQLNNQTLSDDDTALDLQAVINLDAVAAHKHLNKTQMAEHLKSLAEEKVDRAQKLGKGLKDAAVDLDAIEEATARPTKNVKAAFQKKAKMVDNNVLNLQEQMKSGTTGAKFAQQVHGAMHDVKQLRSDELRALDQAHSEANQAARHAARGAQTEARQDARQVRSLSDRMARKDEHYQDYANTLENRAEDSANYAEAQSEDLARRTQDHLEKNLDAARTAVHKDAERRTRDLSAVLDQLEATQKQQGQAFLAQADGVTYGPAPLASIALFGVAGTCLALFFFKRNTQNLPLEQNTYNLLG